MDKTLLTTNEVIDLGHELGEVYNLLEAQGTAPSLALKEIDRIAITLMNAGNEQELKDLGFLAEA